MNKSANKGDHVEILYTGKLKDNTVFDSTDDRGPFKFIVGSENIIQGLSEAIVGMKVGDKKSIEIDSKDAYGDYNQNLLRQIPSANIPPNAKVGDVLTDPNGNNWWLREIKDDSAIIDGNHPLAGQSLIFDIELLKIS